MGHARATTFVGSAGQWVAASWECCCQRRPCVGSGTAWLGCVVSMVGGGMWARVWGGSVVGYRLAAGAGASLWVGLPRNLSGASPDVPGRLAEGGSWGVPHPWGHHYVLTCRSGLWGWGVCRCRSCGRRRCVV